MAIPAGKTILKSALLRRRLSSVLDDVALEVKLSTLRNETLATLLTAALDDVTASFSSHTCAETVLLFTGAFRGLICAKAHGEIFVGMITPASGAGAGI